MEALYDLTELRDEKPLGSIETCLFTAARTKTFTLAKIEIACIACICGAPIDEYDLFDYIALPN